MSVSIIVVRALVEAVESAHVDRRTFLEATGFDMRRLEKVDERIEQAEFDSLVEQAVGVTGDIGLGLLMAVAASSLAYSLVGHLVNQAMSIREGLNLLAQFHRLFSDERSFALEEGGRVATLKLAPSTGSLRCRIFRAELAVAGMYRMVQQFAGDGRPDYVAFEHRAPSYREEYTRIFQGTERFDQPFTGIVLDRRLMDAPQLNRDEEVHALLRVQATKRMAQLEHAVSYAEKVRDHVTAVPQRHDLRSVARALRISPRSLRRRLLEEETTFSDVAEGALASVAKRLLVDERKTIQEVAHEIGFSEASAFCRAFKRWTGSTPKQYQATHIPPARGSDPPAARSSTRAPPREGAS